MSDKERMDDRGRRVIERAMEVLQDPDGDAKIDAAIERKERRQELIIRGRKALRGTPSKTDTQLVDMDELRHYLNGRAAREVNGAVSFLLDGTDASPTVTATWPDAGTEIHLACDGRSSVITLDEDGTVSARGVEDALARLA